MLLWPQISHPSNEKLLSILCLLLVSVACVAVPRTFTLGGAGRAGSRVQML